MYKCSKKTEISKEIIKMTNSIFTPDASFFTEEVAAPEAKTIKKDAVKDLTNAFSKNKESSNGEPDWASLLRNAATPSDKFKIMDAKDAYDAAKKEQKFQAQQTAMESKVTELLATPVRNKAFYDRLEKEQPSLFWNTKVQNQKKADRKAQGLNFHLKGGK